MRSRPVLIAGAAIVLLTMLTARGGHGGEAEIVFEKRAFQKMGITPAGRNRRGLTFEHTARRDAAGTPDLLNIETMTVVGGVIFVEQARPEAPEYACPGVVIDLAAASGQRLAAAFADGPVAATLYD